jgi:hypothetical protein
MNQEPHKRTPLQRHLNLTRKTHTKNVAFYSIHLSVDFEKCCLVSEGILHEDNKKIVTPTKRKEVALLSQFLEGGYG